ncbi:Bacteriophage holin family protein [Caprobacter fermentans]|uniref:Bacteriophage holin family protein n=1 Tax=Caproicibacter fermentans TaxID=2576756 RepID=A0A6N8I2C7_9FIRM|nr:phage holin family protein [Caproicibacter fermentans]MVB12098.1 Bacteriophage holin family protein [Caproicibacter fermentans]OCN02283.1 holin [Clostridium sp. W14A]
MEKVLDDYKIALACMGGVLGWLFGGFDSLIYALIAFVALDYVTGVLLAIREKKVSSEIGFHGICKKVMIFVLVTLGHVIDQYVIGSGSSLRTMLIMFYLSNEGISIIENASEMGIPIPDKLKDVLQQLSKKNDEKK